MYTPERCQYGASLCRGVPGALGPPRARLRAEQIRYAQRTQLQAVSLQPAALNLTPHGDVRLTLFTVTHRDQGNTLTCRRVPPQGGESDVKQTRGTRGALQTWLRTIAAIDV